ncbi:hypothetical protein H2248_006673 [Termitomyces sp. 'cryptogamus']|nr:hypothetical protein H2248_006673 [Termitomyces sp. 'cryptogamus']
MISPFSDVQTSPPAKVSAGNTPPSTCPCIPAWERCLPAWERCLPAWERCLPAWERCLPAWERCLPAWERCLPAWERCLPAWERCLPAWERCLPHHYVVASTPSTNSLKLQVEIETMDTQQIQSVVALLDSGATGLFLDTDYVQ